ncbi:TonB-dependent receptor plug domain-containing protein [Colwellia sp. E2M01]|uniref:TonB-dependent receptor plug domain-containing protein n=1 Tax=Colwellia sp. E2M01 TaxID=2841561 RepID=UPI001C090AE0|nr:TonB-dependent receptor plug domain-containing protein [Colwellia sp. E2M01]MBU2870955.1 TonB-dependent receptor plug domain-containing protein [Colwellia sp. E2M01]
MFNYPKNKLTISITLALSAATTFSAFADEATETNQAIEEVVVVASPILDSQKAALEAKKEATNFVDIIAADTIGRFPDQNLADSLGRIPGVAIERDQGQARYINFRGAPFKYSPIAIDGVVIPGAENGRVARFDSFPSVITSRLIANKAITPNMPGDAVSGFINIETHDPFKFDGFAFNADLGFGKQDLGGGDISKTALKASYSTENWGGMIYTSNNSRDQITDNREYGWLNDNQLGSVEYRNYEVTREDEAFGGKLEYRFDNGAGRVFLSLLESEFNDHELRNQYVLDIEGGMDALSLETPTGQTNTVPLALVERWLQDGNYKSSTSTKTLGFEYDIQGWLLEGRLSDTRYVGSEATPNQVERYGKRYMAGVRINY